MPFSATPTDNISFAGGVTVRGAAVGAFTQIEVTSDPCQKRDGTGNLVFVTPGVYPSACTKSNGAGYQVAIEGVMGPWNTGWDINAGYDLLARIVDPPTFNPGEIGCYLLRIQNSAIGGNGWIRIFQQATNPIVHLADRFFPVANGDFLKWRLELSPGATGHTLLRGLVANMAAPTVWIADTLAGGVIDDATVALNNPAGTYKYGIGGSGAAYEPADLAAQSFKSFAFVANSSLLARRRKLMVTS